MVIPLTNIIHQIFVDSLENFIAEWKPNNLALKVLNHIVSCRTPELGAAVYDCACGERSFVFHSCRDRHCPICQNINNARWAEKQMACSLPVKYYHIVFTLPDTLNSFTLSNQKQVYDALFKAASSALLRLCTDKKYLGATPGFTAVLHTWGQTMQFHPHLHVIITAGGLSEDRLRFVDKSASGYLLPVKVLSKLFRGIFIDTLDKNAPIPYDLRCSLYNTDFFCYLKNPVDHADNVVKYLARYANRVCISANRILSYDNDNKTVVFSYKDNKDGGKQKSMVLPAIEFMRRFLLHVLPQRFMKIRHYGILNNSGKFRRIQLCRNLLNFRALHKLPKAVFRAICKKCGEPLFLLGHLDSIALKTVLLC
jgi:hypothetical protein